MAGGKVSEFEKQIITTPVDAFCVLSGLGRTTVYELMKSGDLESVKIGKRRLVVIDSYRRLIERQRADGMRLAHLGDAANPPEKNRRLHERNRRRRYFCKPEQGCLQNIVSFRFFKSLVESAPQTGAYMTSQTKRIDSRRLRSRRGRILPDRYWTRAVQASTPAMKPPFRRRAR